MLKCQVYWTCIGFGIGSGFQATTFNDCQFWSRLNIHVLTPIDAFMVGAKEKYLTIRISWIVKFFEVVLGIWRQRGTRDFWFFLKIKCADFWSWPDTKLFGPEVPFQTCFCFHHNMYPVIQKFVLLLCLG